MVSLIRSLGISGIFEKRRNNRENSQKNLQDSTPSGFNQIRVNRNYHGEVEDILTGLPAYDVSQSEEDGKNVYGFERELTDREIGYINQELEERDVRGYGFGRA